MGTNLPFGQRHNSFWMAVRKEMTSPYFNMASSFSSSSFCRTITAIIIFLSSSVRWLRSGRSGMFIGAVGGRGPPWGPTEADIFYPSLACRFRDQKPSDERHSSRHSPRAEPQLSGIVQAFHGCGHPRPCFGFYSAFLSSLSHPPTPRLSASPLHLKLLAAHLSARRWYIGLREPWSGWLIGAVPFSVFGLGRWLTLKAETVQFSFRAAAADAAWETEQSMGPQPLKRVPSPERRRAYSFENGVSPYVIAVSLPSLISAVW